ncbi:Sensors of blue-light using FAD [Roseivivax lentus]|uniref:Sensors of blue-light using FAD n=1 Tax=Roseivivax lentus TaxID=633194 RepID=A0A1N7P6E4_9RHOB|nr:BLUF domain-containing protein [Roseivivax lentus]SIT06009.1 Sensors of blue-light using FAD [Roseivivax lentus]
MEYLIYRSRALVAPRSAACDSIVVVSQRNNTLLGLTGFLHAEEGLFIQYLEGSPDVLWPLYERLHSDLRHTDLVMLGHGTVGRRRFSDWSMGYSSTNVLVFEDFLGEVSFKKQTEQASCSEALTFLAVAAARLDLGISDPL